MVEVSQAAARRAVVAAQRFASRRRHATVAEVEAVIGRLGCVQLDAISTVDRSQRLVMSVRAGRLPEDAVDRLLRAGRVFEYWAHEASLIPVSDYRFFRPLMRDASHHQWFGDVLAREPALIDQVMATIRERGPVSARDFGGAGTGYWGWTPAKRVLEALWTGGRLAVAHRRGTERRYDLPERVLPDVALGAPDPTEEERLEHVAERTVAARGLVREARLADYYRVGNGRIAQGRARLAPVVERLVEHGRLERVRLADSGDVALVPPGEGEAIAALEREPRGAFLLSPFDNMLWDRVEARAVFGFDHSLEIYKRPHERVWGYYVLPLVDGSEIVGRVDTKADRQAGVLRALAVHWQARPRPRALREALGRLAWLLRLDTTEVVA
jgi:uncharacterized protein YcaQ